MDGDGVAGPEPFDDEKKAAIFKGKFDAVKTDIRAIGTVKDDGVGQRFGQMQPEADAVLVPRLQAAEVNDLLKAEPQGIVARELDGLAGIFRGQANRRRYGVAFIGGAEFIGEAPIGFDHGIEGETGGFSPGLAAVEKKFIVLEPVFEMELFRALRPMARLCGEFTSSLLRACRAVRRASPFPAAGVGGSNEGVGTCAASL